MPRIVHLPPPLFTDSRGAAAPVDTETDEKVSIYTRIESGEDASMQLWLSKLGQGLAQRLLATDVQEENSDQWDGAYRTLVRKLGPFHPGTEYRLEKFPAGYDFYVHSVTYKHRSAVAARGGERKDRYLYAHTLDGLVRYRSPNEFLPHLLWLATDGTRNYVHCECPYCPGKVRTLVANRLPVGGPRFRAGEWVWVPVTVALTRLRYSGTRTWRVDLCAKQGGGTNESRPCTAEKDVRSIVDIRFWPARILSRHLSYREHQHQHHPQHHPQQVQQQWQPAYEYCVTLAHVAPLVERKFAFQRQRFHVVQDARVLPWYAVEVPTLSAETCVPESLAAVEEQPLDWLPLLQEAWDSYRRGVQEMTGRMVDSVGRKPVYAAVEEQQDVEDASSASVLALWKGCEWLLPGDLVYAKLDKVEQVDPLAYEQVRIVSFAKTLEEGWSVKTRSGSLIPLERILGRQYGNGISPPPIQNGLSPNQMTATEGKRENGTHEEMGEAEEEEEEARNSLDVLIREEYSQLLPSLASSSMPSTPPPTASAGNTQPSLGNGNSTMELTPSQSSQSSQSLQRGKKRAWNGDQLPSVLRAPSPTQPSLTAMVHQLQQRQLLSSTSSSTSVASTSTVTPQRLLAASPMFTLAQRPQEQSIQLAISQFYPQGTYCS